MSKEELELLADLANKPERCGRYETESYAPLALELIARLARHLAEKEPRP